MRQYNSFPPYWTRRQLIRLGVAGIMLPIAVSQISSCPKRNLLIMGSSKQANSSAAEGRLLSRPTHPTATASPGLHPLGLDGQRDGFVYVPKTYQADRPAPLVLMLHGAGGDAHGGLNILRRLADPSLDNSVGGRLAAADLGHYSGSIRPRHRLH